MAFDVSLDLTARPPHVHRESQDRNRRDQRQRPFKPLLVRGIEQEVPADGAHAHGYDNSPVDGFRQVEATSFPQIRQADGDDEKCLEAFAEGDDERLQHGARNALMKVRPSLRI